MTNVRQVIENNHQAHAFGGKQHSHFISRRLEVLIICKTFTFSLKNDILTEMKKRKKNY